MEDEQKVALLIENQVINVEKNLLCEYSDYFRAMFSGFYVEKEKKYIRVDLIDANSMKIIIRYMELGFIVISDYSLSTVSDLAFAANYLQITELIKEINHTLEQQLSPFNWLEIQDLATRAPALKLEQKAVMYGLFSFKYVQPRIMPTIEKLFWYLSHPYLNTESELPVFKFGLQWIQLQKLGADTILIVLCCLDMSRLTREELLQIKDLMKDYVNSVPEKVVDCLHKLKTDFELSVTSVKENKLVLCEMYTETVYNEVLKLVSGSIQRKLKFIPAVAMWYDKYMRAEKSHNFINTFTEEQGFQQWMEINEKNLWGWNITSWTPTKIVMVCGEYGRGTGNFMKDVKVYDVISKEWVKHGVQLPVRRHGGVVIIKDSLYVVGGVGAFRVVLESALIYDLKKRTYRTIAYLPDALQAPAICAHDDEVYVVGLKHIYKFQDHEDEIEQRWTKVIDTEMTPSYLVSFKGYIYVAQAYFRDLYRFRPGIDTRLERIGHFNQPPTVMFSLGPTMFAITNPVEEPIDTIQVEEVLCTNSSGGPIKVRWTQSNWVFGINPAGSCVLMMAEPPIKIDVSPVHQRYLTMYGIG